MKNHIKISKNGNLAMFFLMASCWFVSCVDDSTTEVTVPDSSLVQIVDESPEVFEDESVPIDVTFIEPALDEGSIEVVFSGGATYGTDFVTDPEAVGGVLTIPVVEGAEIISLTFTPITRLGTLEETRAVDLDFSATGGVSFGTNTSTSVTILNRPEIFTLDNLTDFGEVMELEESTSQSFRVSGLGLTGGVEVAAPLSFEVSLDDTDFSETVSLAASDLNADTSLVYVRFSPGFDTLGVVPGSVALTSENAISISVSTSGTGTVQPPTIIANQSDLDFGAAPTNGTSTTESITITGYRLVENISVVTAAPFEVSLDGNSFSSSIALDFTSINPVDGEFVFFARFAPTSGVDGTKNGTITLSSSGATDQLITVTGEEGLSLIAFTSFEEPTGLDVDYVDTGDSTMNRVLVNNPGEAPVQYESVGGELGFNTIYISTGGAGSTDGDDLGVTNKSSIVGTTLEGGYTDGVQGYYADDTDGIIRVVFDEVDVSAVSTLRLTLDYLFNDTDWEVDDIITVMIETGDGLPSTLLSINGDDIETGGLDPEPHIWNQLDVDISSLAGGTIRLILQIETESGAEEVYFDNIRFLGN